MGRRAAPPGEVTLSLVEPLDLLALHAPARRTSGVGGFRGPAAPCRRPQGTHLKTTKLKGSQASTPLRRAACAHPKTTGTRLLRQLHVRPWKRDCNPTSPSRRTSSRLELTAIPFKDAHFSFLALKRRSFLQCPSTQTKNGLAHTRNSTPQNQPSRNRHTRAHCTIIYLHGRSGIDVLIDARSPSFENDLPALGFS